VATTVVVCAALLLGVRCGAHATAFVEENPWGATVTTVHAVFSNHFVCSQLRYTFLSLSLSRTADGMDMH
jgi:hypothetical protein